MATTKLDSGATKEAMHRSRPCGAAEANVPGIQFVHHLETSAELYLIPFADRRSEMREAARDDRYPDSIMVTRGSGMAASGKIAGSRFKVPASRATRVTFLPEKVDCQIAYSPAGRTFGINFARGYLGQLMIDGDRGHEFDPLLFQCDDQLVQLAQTIEHEITAPGFASAMLIDGISRALAVRLLRIDHGTLIAEADRIALPAWKLRRVVDFIDSHLAADIRLNDLAAQAELSPFHFGRVFKQATGTSPYHFVRDRRIERGCKLLVEDTLDIAGIALSCGFANQSHFTSAFTKAMGISPARYRRLKRDRQRA